MACLVVGVDFVGIEKGLKVLLGLVVSERDQHHVRNILSQ